MDNPLNLLRSLINNSIPLSVAYKRINRWYYLRRQKPDPDWLRILSADRHYWEEALDKARNGPRILIATSMGGETPAVSLESVIGAALTLRGANVHFLLCDELLTACQLCTINYYPNVRQFAKYGPRQDLCKGCFKLGESTYRPMGLPVHRYSECVTPEDIREAITISSSVPFKEISKYTSDGVNVGEHALAGTLRFFGRGNLEKEPYAEPVLRRYFQAALLATCGVRRLLQTSGFECALFHHGIYVPQGLTGEVCRRMGVRVVNECAAYRRKTFIFSHKETYHHTLMSEPVSKWETVPWTEKMETELMDYLKSRWYGTKDWIWFQENPLEDLNAIKKETGIDFSKPCIGMLTNVMWDAQLHYPANAFPNMLDWVLQTIAYFAKRTELQLLIRVHPAEILGVVPSRQPIIEEIRKVYPVLPENIFIVPPESKASTYVAMMHCDSVIIYGTKTGVELSCLGIPVIVAGEAWVRNKGITIDASSNKEYLDILDSLPLKKRLNEDTVKRAKKYAYHFFFRRMIPLEFIEPTGKRPIYYINLSSLKELMPGESKGLDVICDGILKGTDFIYPAEEDMRG